MDRAKAGLTLLGLLASICAAHAEDAAATCDSPSTPFCSSAVPLPSGWGGHVFILNQDYPETNDADDSQPWMVFNPTTEPAQYITAVLEFFYDGSIRDDVEESFDPLLNLKRSWYHAPWQSSPLDVNGREPIHGLTRERVSRPFELSDTQDLQWNNYAVGFYNAPGGYTIGQVWADHGNPDASKASSLPEGTVAAKLLFTTAPTSQVPYLAGAPEWDAYVYADLNDPRPTLQSPRAVMKVRLLQIDIAVKDSRVASTTGWVFGTFVYGGGPGGTAGEGWSNVEPVGVMWGNDPGFSGSGTLQETWINPKVTMPHLGFQGRLNGPVDNKISSCLSCHSTAQIPVGQMVPPTGSPPDRWFRNIPSGTPFDEGSQSLDYSLQIMVGLRAFEQANAIALAATDEERSLLIERAASADSAPARDGFGQ